MGIIENKSEEFIEPKILLENEPKVLDETPNQPKKKNWITRKQVSIFAIFSSIALLFIILLVLITHALNPSPIVITDNSGNQTGYYFGEEILISDNNIYTIQISDKNKGVIRGEASLIFTDNNSSLSLSIEKGLVAFNFNSGDRLITDNAIFNPVEQSSLIINANQKTLDIISGKILDQKMNEYTPNTTIEAGYLEASVTNREKFKEEYPYELLLSSLNDNNLLPKELIDINKPIVNLFEPADLSKVINSNKVLLKGEVSLDTVSFKINNSEIELDKDFMFESSQNLKVGSNNFEFSITDNSGNFGIYNFEVNRKDPCAGNTKCGECGNAACPVASNNNSSSSTNTSSNSSNTTSSSCSSSFASQMLSLINSHRQSNGKGTLTLDTKMNTAACNHSVWMKNTGNFSHTGSGGSAFYDRCTAVGTSCDAENIAYNSVATAQKIFDQWKNSAGHNQNMLGSHTKLGVGYFSGYATTLFK